MGDDHPSTIGVLDGLGFALWSMDRMDGALPCYQQVLEGRQRVWGDDAFPTLAAAANLGWVLMDMGDFEAARPYVVSSLEGRRKTLGDANYKTLVSFTALAWLQLNTGKIDEAVALLEPREAEMRRDLAVNPSYLGMYLTALGRSRTVTGRFEDAETALLKSESLAIWRANRRRVLKELVRLYEAWDAADPDAGHDSRAAEWRAKLDEALAGSPRS